MSLILYLLYDTFILTKLIDVLMVFTIRINTQPWISLLLSDTVSNPFCPVLSGLQCAKPVQRMSPVPCTDWLKICDYHVHDRRVIGTSGNVALE